MRPTALRPSSSSPARRCGQNEPIFIKIEAIWSKMHNLAQKPQRAPGGAAEVSRRCRGGAAEVPRRCPEGDPEVTRRCRGGAAEVPRRCPGGDPEVTRRCRGGAAEVPRRCPKLIPRSAPRHCGLGSVSAKFKNRAFARFLNFGEGIRRASRRLAALLTW